MKISNREPAGHKFSQKVVADILKASMERSNRLPDQTPQNMMLDIMARFVLEIDKDFTKANVHRHEFLKDLGLTE